MDDVGVLHFLGQTDLLGRFVLTILLIMSLASWTLILLKLAQMHLSAGRRRDFLLAYHNAPAPADLHRLADGGQSDACARLLRAALEALRRWSRKSEQRLLEPGEATDFIAARLSLALNGEQARLESGLAVLAAVGSTAPFVGLLGTVWGIEHALVAIGNGAQASLDQVAGPVGEALIMTALGLAVAIPAVLSYNAFVRASRREGDALEAFAHELQSFLSTGVPATAAQTGTPSPSRLATAS